MNPAEIEETEQSVKIKVKSRKFDDKKSLNKKSIRGITRRESLLGIKLRKFRVIFIPEE